MGIWGKKQTEQNGSFNVNDHASRYYKKDGSEKRNLKPSKSSPFATNPRCPNDSRGSHNTDTVRGKLVSSHGSMAITRGNKGTVGTCHDCGICWQIK